MIKFFYGSPSYLLKQNDIYESKLKCLVTLKHVLDRVIIDYEYAI